MQHHYGLILLKFEIKSWEILLIMFLITAIDDLAPLKTINTKDKNIHGLTQNYNFYYTNNKQPKKGTSERKTS